MSNVEKQIYLTEREDGLFSFCAIEGDGGIGSENPTITYFIKQLLGSGTCSLQMRSGELYTIEVFTNSDEGDEENGGY